MKILETVGPLLVLMLYASFYLLCYAASFYLLCYAYVYLVCVCMFGLANTAGSYNFFRKISSMESGMGIILTLKAKTKVCFCLYEIFAKIY
jgi:hypothetical protein